MVEVQGNAALVAVEVEETAAALGVRLVARERASAPRGVAPGGLDFQDPSPEVGRSSAQRAVESLVCSAITSGTLPPAFQLEQSR